MSPICNAGNQWEKREKPEEAKKKIGQNFWGKVLFWKAKKVTTTITTTKGDDEWPSLSHHERIQYMCW